LGRERSLELKWGGILEQRDIDGEIVNSLIPHLCFFMEFFISYSKRDQIANFENSIGPFCFFGNFYGQFAIF
jgi:hypothetical protein